jgi:class 3 adenylate cyclase
MPDRDGTVNVASRLESATRETKADLLVCDGIVRHLPPESFEPVRRHKLAIKGKSAPVLAHEIRIHPDGPSASRDR